MLSKGLCPENYLSSAPTIECELRFIEFAIYICAPNQLFLRVLHHIRPQQSYWRLSVLLVEILLMLPTRIMPGEGTTL